MMEIAICLAIIGFALLAIIRVLPLGMGTQRDNREETVINQDATVLLETIRSGARGADNLTNNVYAITNYWTFYNANGTVANNGTDGYAYNTAYVNNAVNPYYSLTNGANIIGVLSSPEFTDGGGNPISDTFNVNFRSNHIVAYVRSISGLAAEKPPQDNQIMRDDTFAYRVYCVNAAMSVDTNTYPSDLFAKQLAANLRELRLTFLWPQLPNGNLGNGRQTFRASIAGQLAKNPNAPVLFYYRSQYFTNAP